MAKAKNTSTTTDVVIDLAKVEMSTDFDQVSVETVNGQKLLGFHRVVNGKQYVEVTVGNVTQLLHEDKNGKYTY